MRSVFEYRELHVLGVQTIFKDKKKYYLYITEAY
jgi:hypothetical protein